MTVEYFIININKKLANCSLYCRQKHERQFGAVTNVTVGDKLESKTDFKTGNNDIVQVLHGFNLKTHVTSALTCMIGYGPSAPTWMSVFGVVLQKKKQSKTKSHIMIHQHN